MLDILKQARNRKARRAMASRVRKVARLIARHRRGRH